MRWTAQKSERFQALRHAESHGTLTVADRAELEALFADLDADENDALGPTLVRMDADGNAMAAEKVALDAEARELARIANEEERLSTESTAYLEQLHQIGTVRPAPPAGTIIAIL